jgi:hypothetical protein
MAAANGSGRLTPTRYPHGLPASLLPISIRIAPPLLSQVKESLATCTPFTRETAFTVAPSANELKK